MTRDRQSKFVSKQDVRPKGVKAKAKVKKDIKASDLIGDACSQVGLPIQSSAPVEVKTEPVVVADVKPDPNFAPLIEVKMEEVPVATDPPKTCTKVVKDETSKPAVAVHHPILLVSWDFKIRKGFAMCDGHASVRVCLTPRQLLVVGLRLGDPGATF